jgi:hypothetical protein
VKRAALSILCGVAFPLSYSVVAGPLSSFIQDSSLRLLLDVPVGWPRLLYFYLFASSSRGSLADNENVLLAYIVGCNIVLYTLVTYFALSIFSFKRFALKESSPPLPPEVL